MAKRDASRPPASEPGAFLQLAGDQFWTVIVVGLVLALRFGWTIHDTLSAEQAVPPLLYLCLAGALALPAACGLLYLRRGADLQRVWSRRRALKDADAMAKEVRRCQRRYAARLSPTVTEELAAAARELEEARAQRDWERLTAALNALDKKLDDHLAFARKSTAREYAESIVVAVLIALLLRAFVVEAFRIPSGSMIPTLQVGDHIFVNKFIYGLRIPYTDVKFGMGLRKPRRGEVIVFKYPREPDKDFIKRIVGIEGDTVEIRQSVIYINGQPIEHVAVYDRPCEYDDKEGGDEESSRWAHHVCEAYRESLDGHPFTAIYDHGGSSRSWPAVTVPAGHVFVMGDNRDNSHDSRYWGFVPFELIKGKAMVIWWSAGAPEGIRFGRIGHLVE